jgi:hypothetical protein
MFHINNKINKCENLYMQLEFEIKSNQFHKDVQKHPITIKFVSVLGFCGPVWMCNTMFLCSPTFSVRHRSLWERVNVVSLVYRQ